MPYVSEHMLLQWSGLFTRGGSADVMDEFAGTLRFAGPGIAEADNQETCDALAAALRAAWVTSAMQIPTIAKLAYVKWNRIGTDGRYASTTRTTTTWYENQVGGAIQPVYPTQISWAATYLTDVARGPASRGRNYFPTSATIGEADNMRVTQEQCQRTATAVAGLIASLNNAAQSEGSGMVAHVMSDVRAGRQSVIKRVSMGNRLDIQRRRANRGRELYAQADVVAG